MLNQKPEDVEDIYFTGALTDTKKTNFFIEYRAIDGRMHNYTPDWPKDLPQAGLLFHGDNKDVLAYLLANGFRGKVKLIYIDPPFDSGADYVRQVVLRETKSTTPLDGEGYTLGEQIQYADIWVNDTFLQYEESIPPRNLLHIFQGCQADAGIPENQFIQLQIHWKFPASRTSPVGVATKCSVRWKTSRVPSDPRPTFVCVCLNIELPLVRRSCNVMV